MDQNHSEKLTTAIEGLDKSVEQLDDHVEVLIDRETFWRSFFKGLFGALGALVGASLVIAIIVFLLQKLSGVPFIGDYVYEILDTIQQNK